jgi:hypothetical protein
MGAFVTGGTGFIGAIILGKSPSILLDGVKMSKQSMYYDSSNVLRCLSSGSSVFVMQWTGVIRDVTLI